MPAVSPALSCPLPHKGSAWHAMGSCYMAWAGCRVPVLPAQFPEEDDRDALAELDSEAELAPGADLAAHLPAGPGLQGEGAPQHASSGLPQQSGELVRGQMQPHTGVGPGSQAVATTLPPPGPAQLAAGDMVAFGAVLGSLEGGEDPIARRTRAHHNLHDTSLEELEQMLQVGRRNAWKRDRNADVGRLSVKQSVRGALDCIHERNGDEMQGSAVPAVSRIGCSWWAGSGLRSSQERQRSFSAAPLPHYAEWLLAGRAEGRRLEGGVHEMGVAGVHHQSQAGGCAG